MTIRLNNEENERRADLLQSNVNGRWVLQIKDTGFIVGVHSEELGWNRSSQTLEHPKFEFTIMTCHCETRDPFSIEPFLELRKIENMGMKINDTNKCKFSLRTGELLELSRQWTKTRRLGANQVEYYGPVGTTLHVRFTSIAKIERAMDITTQHRFETDTNKGIKISGVSYVVNPSGKLLQLPEGFTKQIGRNNDIRYRGPPGSEFTCEKNRERMKQKDKRKILSKFKAKFKKIFE